MSLSALLPPWEPRDKGDENADNWYLLCFQGAEQEATKEPKGWVIKRGIQCLFY